MGKSVRKLRQLVGGVAIGQARLRRKKAATVAAAAAAAEAAKMKKSHQKSLGQRELGESCWQLRPSESNGS